MFQIVNWSSYQSYKDRKPTWIRLSKDFLDDFNFQRMTADARAILPMLWLLASEDDDPVSGLLRFGYETVSFRLRIDNMTCKKAIDECIQNGFIRKFEDNDLPLFAEKIGEITPNKSTSYETVTKPLRIRTQSVTPETEKYIKKNKQKKDLKEKKKVIPKHKPAKVEKPETVSQAVWDAFLDLRSSKNLPNLNETTVMLITKEAEKIGYTLEKAIETMVLRGWGSFDSSWIRENKYPQRGSTVKTGTTSTADPSMYGKTWGEMTPAEREKLKQGVKRG